MATQDDKAIQIPLPLDGETIEIPLSKGYVTIIDAIDGDFLMYKWGVSVMKNHDLAYATAWIDKRSQSLHRMIMARILGRKLERREFVDHKDSNGLNNTRGNLRLATYSQNNSNSRLHSNNKSGYKGVSRPRGRNKWEAQITKNGEVIHLGTYDTPEEAHEVYCKMAIELHGEFARLK